MGYEHRPLTLTSQLPSGKLHSYRKMAHYFIVDYTYEHRDFPVRYVSLPEGIH